MRYPSSKPHEVTQLTTQVIDADNLDQYVENGKAGGEELEGREGRRNTHCQ